MFNIVGWVSHITGKPLSNEEMLEWVDNTVKRIMELKPRQVLEIGVGTDLLLFRITPYINSYTGTDFSQNLVQYLQKNLVPYNWSTRVSIKQRFANELPIEENYLYDTVEINSVAQYFPSLQYLNEVIEKAINATEKGGKIFKGEVTQQYWVADLKGWYRDAANIIFG